MGVCRTSTRVLTVLGLFFFKQKTAYEIETGLEFRRVLFRSHPHRRLGGPRGDGAARDGGLPQERGSMTRISRVRDESGWAIVIVLAVTAAVIVLGLATLRSEERRVGKEGRSGRSRSAYEKYR